MKRPPVAWSRTVAALARTAGWRNVFESTPWPTVMPGHAVGERGERVSASQARAAALERRVGEVVVHPAGIERPSSSPAPRPRRVERRPVDVLRRGLEPDRRSGAPSRDAALSARARSAVIRGPVVTAPSDAELTSAAYLAMTPPV